MPLLLVPAAGVILITVGSGWFAGASTVGIVLLALWAAAFLTVLAAVTGVAAATAKK